MSLMGLDVGTSACKASVFNESGLCLSQHSLEYPLISPQAGYQEINPEQVWQAVCQVIEATIEDCRHDPVQAIAVSSFGETVIPVDSSGKALANGMLYIDSRGQDEARELRSRLTDHEVLQITGTDIQPMYSICKMMWLKHHCPEVYARTWKFMPLSAYILFRLGGKAHMDYSLAARTMAFDIQAKTWSPRIIGSAGLDPEHFPPAVQSGSIIGRISAMIAEKLGLARDIDLVAGGHDQPCAALGAGVIHSELAVDGLGSTECITPAFNQPVLNQDMAGNHFACVPHVVSDMYVTYAFTFTSGSVLKWFRNQLGAVYRQEAVRSGVNVYTLMIDRALARDSGFSPSPLLLLPHFAGAATPYMDHSAQGALFGLNIDTTSDDIIRAILEGITFEIMINLERLQLAGITIDHLMAVGGLARSASFLQLKATMMGKVVSSLNVSEAGTLGVAMLAGIARGIYRDPAEAVTQLVQIKQTYEPEMKQHTVYQERFAQYRDLYAAVKRVFPG